MVPPLTPIHIEKPHFLLYSLLFLREREVSSGTAAGDIQAVVCGMYRNRIGQPRSRIQIDSSGHFFFSFRATSMCQSEVDRLFFWYTFLSRPRSLIAAAALTLAIKDFSSQFSQKN